MSLAELGETDRLRAKIEWLESVIAAGREMYERACAERDAAHVRAYEDQDEASATAAKLQAEIERLRAALSAAEQDGSGE